MDVKQNMDVRIKPEEDGKTLWIELRCICTNKCLADSKGKLKAMHKILVGSGQEEILVCGQCHRKYEIRAPKDADHIHVSKFPDPNEG